MRLSRWLCPALLAALALAASGCGSASNADRTPAAIAATPASKTIQGATSFPVFHVAQDASIDYLDPEVVAGLEGFARSGGLVLLTADCKVNIKGSVNLGVTPAYPDAARIAELRADGAI